MENLFLTKSVTFFTITIHTIFLMSSNVSATAYSNGAISSSGCVKSGTITGFQPAAYAALMPFGESSTAMQSDGSSPICAQAWR